MGTGEEPMAIATKSTDRPVLGDAQLQASGRRTARSTSILLVEDEPVTAEVFARALLRDGHSVHVARDGLQAVHKLREHPPDLLVLDLGLPHLPGKEILERVRSGDTPNIPVIVVSGAANRPTGLDADRWLLKPLRPRHLVETVRELLDRGEPG
jgi:two-component system response regulator TctD